MNILAININKTEIKFIRNEYAELPIEIDFKEYKKNTLDNISVEADLFCIIAYDNNYLWIGINENPKVNIFDVSATFEELHPMSTKHSGYINSLVALMQINENFTHDFLFNDNNLLSIINVLHELNDIFKKEYFSNKNTKMVTFNLS